LNGPLFNRPLDQEYLTRVRGQLHFGG